MVVFGDLLTLINNSYCSFISEEIILLSSFMTCSIRLYIGEIIMKKIKLIVTMIIAINVASMAAIADETDKADKTDKASKTYVSAQYVIASYDEDSFEEANPTLLVGGFGKFFNKNFALEGRLGLGLQDDDLATNRSVEIDGLLGIYGAGHFNLSGTSSIYGLIGYTRIKTTTSVSGIQIVSFYDSGLSLGAGADIGISKNVALNIEYVQYLHKTNYDISSIGLGAVYKL